MVTTTMAYGQNVNAPQVGTMAAASVPLPPGVNDAMLAPFKRLEFDPQVQSRGLFTRFNNSIFKPQGDPPFPAVVVAHSCGGVTSNLRERAIELLDAGYLIIVPDSFGPRGQRDCRNGVIRNPVAWRDFMDAAAQLRKLPEVDANRVFLVGFSMGSIAASALSGPTQRSAAGGSTPFRAVVGWYGSCGATSPQAGGRPLRFLLADVDTPLLLLMAQGDRETPIRPYCFPLLDELKAAGKPVQWHIYPPPTTHAWDYPLGYSLTLTSGETIYNRYDRQATVDAMRRTLEFLRQFN